MISHIKINQNFFALGLWLGVSTLASASPRMYPVSTAEVNRGAEIVAFDSARSCIYTSGSSGVTIYHFDLDANLELKTSFTFSNTEEWEPTSIAFDPAGRDFAVVTWIPTPSNKAPGMLQVIDAATHRPIWQLSIGNHPDCIMFSPDGQRLIIANEAEPGDPTIREDQPGAITILDLTEIKSASDFIGFNDSQTFEFTQDHLGAEASLDSLRISAGAVKNSHIDIEPEFLAPTNEGVWVSLQENNAIAYFDYDSTKWTRIHSLGALQLPMDLLENDQISIASAPMIQAIHQPDTIVLFETDGSDYLLLANEGEGGDSDTIKLTEAISNGLIDPKTVRELNTKFASEPSIGKLRISTVDGDTDNDADIDTPTILGTRGISIHDALTGEQIWDSGSQFELITSLLWPNLYNHNDTRSDRSGPEPEGLAIGYFESRVLGFVGLERSHAVLMYELTDPLNPKFLDAKPLPIACNPEGLKFIQRGDKVYLFVASEDCDELRVFEIK